MKITIIHCDSCDRCNDGDDETSVGEYIMQPKMGEEGYLIDSEHVDLCKDCLTIHKKKYPTLDFVYLSPHNGKRTQV